MAGGSGREGRSLEDMFYEKEMQISKLAFTRQFTHSVVYAWVKLKEQVSSHKPGLEPRMTDLCTGNPQHHLDMRVHRAEPEGEDWKLHKCLLVLESWLAWSAGGLLEYPVACFSGRLGLV